MKILLESDVFDIVNRIKEIDEGYFILYDLDKAKFELHNLNQPFNTYCLTIPYNEIDEKIIKLIWLTSIINIDNIIDEIDNNNKDIDKNNLENVKNYTDYYVREIYGG